ncbi:SAM-dependent methyltransferase [Coxiella endosymbiont of Amblyomma americanum]|nr:SAM-dependent methyltransferase [Coxiella endosymbiont of Amblyomma americanum]AUJ59033.1 protein-(glutamine-N5) methyltransferase, release factor-specific [Coxiella-like endosymbiont of Amblyomma americanum]
MTIKKLLDNIIQKLSQCSETARLDAEILVGAVLEKSRADLLAHPEVVLTTKQQRQIMRHVERRLFGEPIAYILGKKEFWSLSLVVTSDVFIPRPETEILVEHVLKLLPKDKKIQLADLGTGSGAIALALATECPNWHIDAVDISPKALKIAKTNVEHYKIKNVNFYLGKWCKILPRHNYHAIVGNPPYISNKYNYFQKLKYEPKEALFSGPDGLSDIKIIIEKAKNYLSVGGWLLLEHGFDQTKKLVAFMQNIGYQNIRDYPDLSGLPRMIVGKIV